MVLNVFRVVHLTWRCAFVALATMVVLWLLTSWFCVFQLTRRARAPFAEPPPSVSWGRLESLRLTTADHQAVGAWFVRGPSVGPSVLLLHGNGDSRISELPLAEFFAKRGCSVLLLSLRAHGDSTGEFNDIGYGARHDVVAAVDYLEQQRQASPLSCKELHWGRRRRYTLPGRLAIECKATFSKPATLTCGPPRTTARKIAFPFRSTELLTRGWL